MDFMRRVWQQLRQIWQGMSRARRVGIGTLTALCMAVIGGVAYWASQPDYRVLFSGLSAEDAGAITNKLQTQGVPYRLSGGGQTVLVPAEQVAQLRVDMAVDGLPAKSGKGFDLFDTSSLSMTPLAERVNLLRALQSEMAKTIMQLDPIAFARVHIVLPDPSPFIRDQKPATASVVLRLKPGAILNRNISSGIVALVARGVEGLTPDHVTLVDGNGHVLSEPPNPDASMADTELEYRKQLESSLAAKAEEMLAQALGPNRAIVRVSADINFKKTKEKKESYNPDDKVVITERVTSSKSTTPASGARGSAGTASNVPGRTGQSNNGASDSKDETTETAYAVSKTTQEIEDHIGTVERLTVAAMVDLPKGETNAPVAGMTLQDAQEIIKTAVGFKLNRDEIKITDTKLVGKPDLNVNEAEWEKLQYWQGIANIVRNGSLGIAALVGLVLGWMVFRRLRPAPEPAPTTSPENDETFERVTAVARDNPAVVARALNTWLENAGKPPQRVAA